MSHNVFKIFLVALFLLYFLGSFYTSGTLEGEAYPFFSWFVFTKVPPKFQEGYTIRILKYGDKQLHSPVSFEDAYDVYMNRGIASPQYNYMIRALGTSVENKDLREIKRHRHTLEATFLSQPVVYEVVKIKFSTLERWRTGQVLESKSIAVFNVPKEL